MTSTIAATTYEQPAHLTETISLPSLTFADWQAIAIQCGRDDRWAYY